MTEQKEKDTPVKKVRGLRGAVDVPENTAPAIIAATE
ncbi:MAG: hypothetical protein PWP70_1961, partial [Moorella sp. (in: firmicutes)]|nr:hypothetical protein [Moorella sp. (in: firmicutes)]